MVETTDFWDRIAVKYAASPVRDQAAYEFTLERVASHLRSTDRVLELGCGTGTTALKLAPFAGEIVATDFAPGMIAQARAKAPADTVAFRVADVHDAGLEPASFDVVMGFNLLHLVPDLPALVDRAHTLLKPGGLFITKTPCLTDPLAGWKMRALVKVIPLMQLVGKAPFVRFHTIRDLQRQITRPGFDIVETGNYPRKPPSHFVVARKA